MEKYEILKITDEDRKWFKNHDIKEFKLHKIKNWANPNSYTYHI